MRRSWIIDGRAIASKVRNVAGMSPDMIRKHGANRECPNCHFRIDNSDISYEWPGLPAGVKFDPSDVELIDHLAAKCGVGNLKPHVFLDEYIPTLEGENGICYTHPENLPGARKDGSSVHFFHKTINAYATGQRKRRKIHAEDDALEERVRWHKTGRTKPVMENGIQRGCKKIMVLYNSSKKGFKPYKSNWVMHQYHLGTDEDEKENEYVVSKIFYQQQKQNDECLIKEDLIMLAHETSPKTPKVSPPNPSRPEKSAVSDDAFNTHSSSKEQGPFENASHVPGSDLLLGDDEGCSTWLAGESQAIENSNLNDWDDSLFCNEILASPIFSNNLELNHGSISNIANNINDTTGNCSSHFGVADLGILELDTPPDFQDLQFGSQDSIFDWIDRL